MSLSLPELDVPLETRFEMLATYAVRTAAYHLRVKNSRAMEYLLSRGLTGESIAKWDLGYWTDGCPQVLEHLGLDRGIIDQAGFGTRQFGRIVLPLRDVGGNPLGFVGRQMPDDEHPVRYLYPDKSPFFDQRSHLLGLDRIISDETLLTRPPIFVEGPFDVLRGQELGFPMVTPHGTSFTQEQALLIKSLGHNLLIICPDGGDEDAKRNMLRSTKKWKGSLPPYIHLMELPSGVDPGASDYDTLYWAYRSARPI